MGFSRGFGFPSKFRSVKPISTQEIREKTRHVRTKMKNKVRPEQDPRDPRKSLVAKYGGGGCVVLNEKDSKICPKCFQPMELYGFWQGCSMLYQCEECLRDRYVMLQKDSVGSGWHFYVSRPFRNGGMETDIDNSLAIRLAKMGVEAFEKERKAKERLFDRVKRYRKFKREQGVDYAKDNPTLSIGPEIVYINGRAFEVEIK